MSNVIIFPTDTVYGIGASIKDSEGIEKIYEIKKRSKSKPLPILCANLEQIKSISEINSDEEKLILRFLPGPLTLIVKANDFLKTLIGYETVGVRIPNHPIALEIIKKLGPLATTSVNESGSTALNDYETIKNIYTPYVDKIYKDDPNFVSLNQSSTIIDCTSKPYKLLRPGFITLEEILYTINE